jgi:hypothetical protein
MCLAGLPEKCTASWAISNIRMRFGLHSVKENLSDAYNSQPAYGYNSRNRITHSARMSV